MYLQKQEIYDTFFTNSSAHTRITGSNSFIFPSHIYVSSQDNFFWQIPWWSLGENEFHNSYKNEGNMAHLSKIILRI